MNIKLLDKNRNIIGEVDNFYSLIWHRKYFDTGAFELVCAPNDALLETAYLYRADAKETGRVERVQYEQTDTGALMFTVSGRFLESYLSDRIIYPTYTTYSAKQTGAVIADLIRLNLIAPSDNARKLANSKMGTVEATPNIEALQISYDNLSEYIYELCLQNGCSVRAVFDFDTNEIVFEVWNGKDRTQDQELNNPAVFANEFDNINTLNYTDDITDYRNYAYIAGEDGGTNRVIKTINNVLNGEERRELFVDARDLQSEDEDGNPISSTAYTNMLLQRGREKIAEWLRLQTVDCDISVHNKSLIYKEDYDLGDICTVKYEAAGIIAEKRITEIIETWEENALNISAVFGEDTLNFWSIGRHR